MQTTALQDHDAATAIAREQLERALKEMLGEVPGAFSVHTTPEHRRHHLVDYLLGRFGLDEDLYRRFAGPVEVVQEPSLAEQREMGVS